MASSITEAVRQGLEDIENLERAGAICLAEQDRAGNKSRKRTLWDHRVKHCALELQRRSRAILDLLHDKDGMRREELAAMVGLKAPQRGGEMMADERPPPPPIEGGSREIWRAFYDRLKVIQDYYKSFGSQNEYPEMRDANYFVLDALEQVPSLSSIFLDGEERGKVLALTPAYDNFVNWKKYRQHRELEHRRGVLARLKRAKFDREKKKGMQPASVTAMEIDIGDPEVQKKLQFYEMDYVRFLRSALTDFKNVPRHCKYRDEDYEKYLSGLRDYLDSFYRRAYPLAHHTRIARLFQEEFERAWGDGRLSYWKPPSCELTGFYAPATDKLFASESACQGHMASKKYAKAAANFVGKESARLEESKTYDRKLALSEFVVSKLVEQMAGYLENTTQHVRKKQSRSLEELQEEQSSDDDDMAGFGDYSRREDAGDVGSDDNDDNDGKKVRNPLNLPLGWDGRPIPFWLYKLHGLGQEFKCEICGNHSYWGRRVFERHFQEWRHAFGMRCLKIPNTLHFKEITKIDDAISLYERLKNETEAKSFLADQEIEVEDTEGNVMTPQTYEDLRRQGII